MAATIVTTQGLSTALPGGVTLVRNLTAVQVIKGEPGILNKVIPQTVGTGSLVIADGSGAAYSATTAYVPGVAVTYSATLYWCILASTGNLPTNGTYWATAPTAAMIIDTIPVAGLTAGIPVTLDVPCPLGIIVSTVPSGGVYSFTIS